MRFIRSSHPMRAATAVIALGSVSAAVSLLHAQVVKCYVEVCVPAENGGEHCYQKPIACPKQPI